MVMPLPPRANMLLTIAILLIIAIPNVLHVLQPSLFISTMQGLSSDTPTEKVFHAFLFIRLLSTRLYSTATNSVPAYIPGWQVADCVLSTSQQFQAM